MRARTRRVAAQLTVGATLLISLAVAGGPAEGVLLEPDLRSRDSGAVPTDITGLPPISTWSAKQIPLPANDVVYDPSRQTLLASVAGRDPSVGNEVVELDPATGAIIRHVFVGSEPGQLAITDDHSTLYVGLLGTNGIARVDLTTFTLVSSFSTGWNALMGPRYVEDIEAAPGRNDVVVASLTYGYQSGSDAGVFAYDDGVALPEHTEANNSPHSIEFGRSPGSLYGLWSGSPDSFFWMTLDSTGVQLNHRERLSEHFGWDIEFIGGHIYSPTGVVFDPVIRSVLGRFPASGGVEVIPRQDRIVFLSDNATVSIYDTTTFDLVESRPFDELFGFPGSLVRTDGRLAAATGSAIQLIGPRVRGGAVDLPPPPDDTINEFEVTDVELETNALLADSSRGLVYATLPSTEAMPNELVAFDPRDGSVVDHVRVGSEPGPMALTDDASTLYVGLSGTNSIVEVDLSSFTLTRSFSTGEDPTFGPRYAEDLATLPNRTDVVVAALYYFVEGVPRQAGNFVFEGGMMLPIHAPPTDGAKRIETGNAPARVYGSSFDTYYKMVVTSGGIHQKVTRTHMATGFDITWADGLLYATTGRVIDPDAVRIMGTYAGAGDGPIAAVTSQDRTYQIVSEFSSQTLREFDLTHLRPIASRTLWFSGTAHALVSTGSGLAASTDTHVLFLNPPD